MFQNISKYDSIYRDIFIFNFKRTYPALGGMFDDLEGGSGGRVNKMIADSLERAKRFLSERPRLSAGLGITVLASYLAERAYAVRNAHIQGGVLQDQRQESLLRQTEILRQTELAEAQRQESLIRQTESLRRTQLIESQITESRIRAEYYNRLFGLGRVPKIDDTLHVKPADVTIVHDEYNTKQPPTDC